jgi:hypothetical protein
MLNAGMRRIRLGLILLVAGLAAKSAAVVAYHLFRSPVLARVLTTYDPLGVLFADRVLPLFFDLRGIAPPPGAPATYEILLVIAFALQCFVLGFAVSEVRRLSKRHIASRPNAPPVVE